MNESEIADRLKENLPKPQITTTVNRADDVTPSDTGYVSDIGDALDMYKMYDFFGVEVNYRNSQSEQMLQTVYRWAADKVQSTDYLTVAKTIMQYEQMMGGSTIGSRLDRMYKYVKLDDQINRLKSEQGWL